MRPNILLITTDQQRFDTVGAHGNPFIDTPHLDWLAAEGISYRRAYADCPLCMPSRATIMTGISGVSLGITENNTRDFPLARHETLPTVLGAAGYQTRAQGKMHFHPVRAHFGFQTMELPMDYYRERHRNSPGAASLPKEHGVGENEMQPVISTVHENESLTHWTVARSIDFLETRDPTRPFFLWTSFTKPHPPFDPPLNYWLLYANRSMPDPVTGDWSAQVDRIPVDAMVPTWILNGIDRMSPEQIVNIRRAYYACITHIDYALGLLFARMRESGLLENTWILFTSDHGELLGDHHMGGKTNFIDGSAHIPLLIRPPAAHGTRSPLAGASVDTLVSLADIMPTILARASVAGGETEGEDLVSFVDVADPDRVVVGESGRAFALITQRYKYHYYAAGGDELLFDVREDPSERTNLAAPERRSAQVEDLLSAMRAQLAAALSQRSSRWVENGSLRRVDPPAGRDAVIRWPGFHSTVYETDVLH